MNILPKKRWHVKNKDNAARVEADEARDRKKKNDEKIRSLIATQEARADYLRKRARGDGFESKSVITSQDALRLFADVEENRNLITSNKEYEEELKQEKEAHEKKLGILKLVEADAIRKQKADPLLQMKQVEEKFDRIREANRVAASKERAAAIQVTSSCSSLFADDIKAPGTKRNVDEKALDEKEAKRRRLERLRAERLARERGERERAAVVLCKSMGLSSMVNAAAASIEAASTVTDERHLPFNSAFNPELSNFAAERRNAHREEKKRRRYPHK
nr:leukocyte receptor cluster [Hymenolepis microstoma]